jgi:sulfide:quinone oxidoreductase
VRSSALLGVSGFVHADARTLQTDHDSVAIGDVASVRLPNGKALPKAGVFAHAEGKVVAERIAARVEGKASVACFAGNNGALSDRKWLGGGSSPPEGSAKAAQIAFLSR